MLDCLLPSAVKDTGLMQGGPHKEPIVWHKLHQFQKTHVVIWHVQRRWLRVKLPVLVFAAVDLHLRVCLVRPHSQTHK